MRYHLSHLTRDELANIHFLGEGRERGRGYGGRQGHGRYLDVFVGRVHEVIFGECRTGSLIPCFFGSTCLADLISQIKQRANCWPLLRKGRDGLNLDLTVDGGTDSG